MKYLRVCISIILQPTRFEFLKIVSRYQRGPY